MGRIVLFFSLVRVFLKLPATALWSKEVLVPRLFFFNVTEIIGVGAQTFLVVCFARCKQDIALVLLSLF